MHERSLILPLVVKIIDFSALRCRIGNDKNIHHGSAVESQRTAMNGGMIIRAETFNPKDGSVVAADGSRETIYNFELVECIDEVIHALTGAPIFRLYCR